MVESIESAVTSFGRREWTFLSCMLACNFMMGASVSLQAPLYPPEATKKGVSASVYGAVLGTIYLVSFIGNPVISICLIKGQIGKWKFGVKACYLYVYFFLDVLCVFLYGFLDLIDTTWIFVLSSFILRILDGIAASGTCANFIAICLVFPKRIALVSAVSEALYFGSTAAGPVLGELLYALGGYITPFVVFGTIMVCIGLLACVYLPEVPKFPVSEFSSFSVAKELLELFRIPRFVLFFFTSMLTTFGTGYISTNLQADLTQFELSSVSNGLMFALVGLPLAASPLWGFVADVTGRGDFIALAGTLTSAVGIILLGPISFIPINPTVMITGIGLFLFGTGQGALAGSNFYNLVCGSGSRNDATELKIIRMVGASVFYVMGLSLGNFLGPTVAGVMFEAFSFRMSLNLVWVCYALLFSVLVVVTILKKRNQPSVDNAEISADASGTEEVEPLLKTHSSHR